MGAPRDFALDELAQFPWFREVIQSLPRLLRPTINEHSYFFAIEESGNIVSSLQDPEGSYHGVTGALEYEGWLYVSSLFEGRLGRIDLTLKGIFDHDEYQ